MFGVIERVLAGIFVAMVVVLATASGSFALDQPDPPVLFPDDPDLQQAYEDGFGTGYSVGADDGYSNGSSEAREQSSLRDDVASEVDEEPVEGGRDLGAEIEPTPSTSPTPSEDAEPAGSAAATAVIDRTGDDEGFDIPWWPIAFAVAATAWFVTRRARPGDD